MQLNTADCFIVATYLFVLRE